jgi:hypothetical protein
MLAQGVERSGFDIKNLPKSKWVCCKIKFNDRKIQYIKLANYFRLYIVFFIDLNYFCNTLRIKKCNIFKSPSLHYRITIMGIKVFSKPISGNAQRLSSPNHHSRVRSYQKLRRNTILSGHLVHCLPPTRDKMRNTPAKGWPSEWWPLLCLDWFMAGQLESPHRFHLDLQIIV